MILAIGLGNPGPEYQGTRHNIGREIVAAFAKKHEIEMTANPKLKAIVGGGTVGKQRYALVLPETFMNKSGEAAKAARLWAKAKPENIFVVHDDADIPFGNTKLSFNRDSAGHKGVESVMRALGTKKFWRLRIGIGAAQPKNISLRGERRLGDKRTKKKNRKETHVSAEKLVLKKFTPAEEPVMRKVRLKTVGALGELASEPPEKVMNHYNK